MARIAEYVIGFGQQIQVLLFVFICWSYYSTLPVDLKHTIAVSSLMILNIISEVIPLVIVQENVISS